MAPPALLRSFLYADDWDATVESNLLQMSASQAALPGSTFRSVLTNGGWEDVGASGLKTFNLSAGGYWSAATTSAQDPQSFNQLGVQRVFTLGLDETETAPAFIFRGGAFDYQWLGEHNTSAPFTLAGRPTDGVGGVVRGQLAAKLQSKAATGLLGSVVQLGATSASQYAYASFHVFSAGTSITVQVQSAAASNFASPTTRATLGPITAVGGTYMTRVAGAITDQYWRLNVSAITGTFSVAGAIAVQ